MLQPGGEGSRHVDGREVWGPGVGGPGHPLGLRKTGWDSWGGSGEGQGIEGEDALLRFLNVRAWIHKRDPTGE